MKLKKIKKLFKKKDTFKKKRKKKTEQVTWLVGDGAMEETTTIGQWQR